MNSKKRLIAAIRGEAVDRIPFSPFFAYVWDFFPDTVRDAGVLALHHEIGADPLWRGAPCPVVRNVHGIDQHQYEEQGCVVTVTETPVGKLQHRHRRSDDGATDFLIEHPLKCEDDFKIQLWIEEHAEYRPDLAAVHQHFAGDGREGLSLGMLCPGAKSAYQRMVEHLVGTEELIYAQVDYPDLVAEVWAAMVENDRKAVQTAVDSPYDYFITWEDSGTQNYSPAQYDRFIGSEIEQWCRILNDAGKHYVQHACGHVHDLLPVMKRNGVCAVESISPPPTGNIELAAARDKVGADFGIIGGIEPTKFLNLDGTELAAYVERVVADGRGGPFILANSDSCPPGVTVEKFKLVADVARSATI